MDVTETREAAVRRMYDEGFNARQTARALKLTVHEVSTLLRKHALKQPKIRVTAQAELDEALTRLQNGEYSHSIAEDMLLSVSTVNRVKRESGMSASMEEKREKKKTALATMTKLHAEGMLIADIRKQIDTTDNNFRVYVRELGIKDSTDTLFEAQNKKILRLHKQGRNIAQIAGEVGVKERRVMSTINGAVRGSDASHGVVGGAYMISGCTCGECTKARDILNNEFRLENLKSSQAAHHNHYIWTGPELEVLSRADLTARQCAEMIGRTISAVNGARFKMRRDPKWAQGYSLDAGSAPRQRKPSGNDIAIMVDRSNTAKTAAEKTGFSMKTVNNYRAKDKLSSAL